MTNYTLLLQNTTTKQCFVFNLEDIGYPQDLYYKFNIKLDNMQDGEYQYLLFWNPKKFDISINPNNIYVKQEKKILVTFDNILTEGVKILSAGEEIPVLTTGLIQIGNYVSNKLEYNKTNEYITYNG